MSVFTGTYALAEAPNPGPGFTKGAWNCGSATMPTATTVTVTTGQDVSCTIKITVQGHDHADEVVDPAGAGDPASWTLSADPQNITGQALVSGNGKDGVDKVSVFTGTYALAEAPTRPRIHQGRLELRQRHHAHRHHRHGHDRSGRVLHDQEHP